MRSHLARITAVLAAASLLAGCAWIRQANVSLTGADGNAPTELFGVSANGRYVYFNSYATDLVPETAGTDPSSQGFYGIFRRDNQTGRTILLRTQALLMEQPALSADHQVLLIRDGRSGAGPHVWNRGAGTVAAFAVDSNEQQVPGEFRSAALSGDGRFVAFRIASLDGLKTFIRDLQLGTTRPVAARPPDPDNPYLGYYGGFGPLSLSRDGSVLSVQDCVRSGGSDRAPRCEVWSYALIEVATGTVARPLTDQARSFTPRLSDDGRIVAYWDGQYVRSYNRISGARQIVSVDTNGQPTLGQQPSISANGRYVAFVSRAPNSPIVDEAHVYVRDRKLGITTLASSNVDLQPLRGTSAAPAISADGRYVAFRFDAAATATEPAALWRVYTKSVLIPRITDVSPDSVGRAQPVHVTITGSGFRPNADVVIGRRGHALFHSALEITETSITFDVGTDFGTPLGAYDVTVAIPGTGPGLDAGAAANCAGCFTVTAT